MRIFNVEQSKTSYLADFVLYAITIVLLGTYLLTQTSWMAQLDVWGLVLLGGLVSDRVCVAPLGASRVTRFSHHACATPRTP